MDVNREVIRFNSNIHQFKGLETPLEKYIPELGNQFDLIIARDVLEHVIDVKQVLENVKAYLNERGLFHFITPNGKEDVWKHVLTYSRKKSPSELLINHVNYFDGKGLLDFLKTTGFHPLEYYNYKLKTTIRGRGWQVADRLMAPVSKRKSSAPYLREPYPGSEPLYEQEILHKKWYLHPDRRRLSYFICWFHHARLIKLPPEWNIGHEIYGLFSLVQASEKDQPGLPKN